MKRFVLLGACGSLLAWQLASGADCKAEDTAVRTAVVKATADTRTTDTKATDTKATDAKSTDTKSTTAKKSASEIKSAPGEKKSLYERVGGEKAIAAVVDDFVDRAAKDPKVNFTRKGTPKEWKPTKENIATLKKHTTQFICHAAGGSQKYEGKDLKTVHEGMQITDAEFDAAAADFSASLEKHNVAKPEHDELMKIVASTHDDIVEKKASKK